jgi:hypothetical protein
MYKTCTEQVQLFGLLTCLTQPHEMTSIQAGPLSSSARMQAAPDAHSKGMTEMTKSTKYVAFLFLHSRACVEVRAPTWISNISTGSLHVEDVRARLNGNLVGSRGNLTSRHGIRVVHMWRRMWLIDGCICETVTPVHDLPSMRWCHRLPGTVPAGHISLGTPIAEHMCQWTLLWDGYHITGYRSLWNIMHVRLTHTHTLPATWWLLST